MLLNICTKEIFMDKVKTAKFRDMNALHLAIVHSLPDTLQKILDKCKIFKAKNEMCLNKASGDVLRLCYGSTINLPLHLAVVVGNFAVIDCLVRNKLKLDQQDDYGNTVFHALVLASKYQSEVAIDTLNFILSLCKQHHNLILLEQTVSEKIYI